MADSFQLKAILSAVDKISPTLAKVRVGINATHKTFRDLGSASRGLLGSVGIAGRAEFRGDRLWRASRGARCARIRRRPAGRIGQNWRGYRGAPVDANGVRGERRIERGFHRVRDEAE
jgi:hypothetical protein